MHSEALGVGPFRRARTVSRPVNERSGEASTRQFHPLKEVRPPLRSLRAKPVGPVEPPVHSPRRMARRIFRPAHVATTKFFYTHRTVRRMQEEDSLVALVAIATALAAGVLHLIVAPMHFAEHLGQGLFFVALGTLQIFWALWFFRRPQAFAYAAGIVIALGSIVVWVIAIEIRAPFQSGAETPEPIAYATKAVEAVTLVCLLALPWVGGRGQREGARSSRAVVVLVALLLGVAGGGVAYGAGLVGEMVAPGQRLVEIRSAEESDEHTSSSAAGD